MYIKRHFQSRMSSHAFECLGRFFYFRMRFVCIRNDANTLVPMLALVFNVGLFFEIFLPTEIILLVFFCLSLPLLPLPGRLD